MMSTSILHGKNGSIVTYKNSRNTSNSDRDSGNDNGRDSYGVYKDDSEKIIYTKDELGTFINHMTTIT